MYSLNNNYTMSQKGLRAATSISHLQQNMRGLEQIELISRINNPQYSQKRSEVTAGCSRYTKYDTNMSRQEQKCKATQY